MTYPNEQPQDDEQGPGPGWLQPLNGGTASPLGPGRPHSVQVRSPQAGPLNAGGPAVRPINAGGAAFFAAPAGPSENANGASAFAMGNTSRGNAGSPNVASPTYSPFGNYTGNSGQGPHQVRVSTSPAEPTMPTQGEALESFIASHQTQQGGGQQQGQQGGGQQADEAEAGTTEGAGEAAGVEGAGAAGASGAAEGVELAAMFL